jgi:hypothetical protein
MPKTLSVKVVQGGGMVGVMFPARGVQIMGGKSKDSKDRRRRRQSKESKESQENTLPTNTA